MSKGQACFTFCVPNLNKIAFLPACIESILKQEYPSWHCVFVDGYSTDGSWEYMQQYGSDSRFTLLRGRKNGMYADWNECLQHVDSEYFYILTSDDTCSPDLASETISALDQFPDIDACHFQFAYINQEGAVTRSPQQITQHQFPLYAHSNTVMHRRSGLCEFFMHYAYRSPYVTITSLVFRHRLIQKLGGFHLNYGSSGDYDWTMRLCLETDILYIPKLLATWRIYEGQATVGGRSPDTASRGLNIAQANLQLLAKKQWEWPGFSATLLPNDLTTHLSYEYDFRCYKQALKDGENVVSIGLFLQLILKYPLIFWNHLYLKLHRSKSYNIHQSRTAFARRLIKKYSLAWPPVKL